MLSVPQSFVLFVAYSQKDKHELSSEDFEKIGDITDGFSGMT